MAEEIPPCKTKDTDLLFDKPKSKKTRTSGKYPVVEAMSPSKDKNSTGVENQTTKKSTSPVCTAKNSNSIFISNRGSTRASPSTSNESVAGKIMETSSSDFEKFKSEMADVHRQSMSELKQFILESFQKSKRANLDDILPLYGTNNEHGRLSLKRKSDHTISESSDDDELIPSAQKDDVVQQIDDLLYDEIESDKEGTVNAVKFGEKSSGLDLDLENSEFENFLEQVEQEYSLKDVEGKSINPKVSSIIDQFFVKTLNEEKLKELYDKYPRPANFHVLLPSVNREIWTAVKSTTRSSDIRLQKLQTKIIKSSYAFANVIDKLMEMKKGTQPSPNDFSNVIRMSLDSLTLLAQANKDMIQKRKDILKPDLPMPYKLLCNPSAEGEETDVSSGWLFGKDLAKKLKEVKEANSVSYQAHQSAGNKYSRSYGQAYGYNNYRSSNRNYSTKGRSFLSQGHHKKLGQSKSHWTWKSKTKEKSQKQ